MTLPIKELGGLTDAEIQLRISEANEKQAQMLEEKLQDHADVIDRRLAATDQEVRAVGKQYHELRTDVALLVESDKQKKSMLEELISKGERWHQANLELHAVLVQDVSKIQVEQKRLVEQVKFLEWVATLSSLMAKGFTYIMEFENARLFVIGAIILFSLHLFAPHFVPVAIHWLEHLK